MKAFLSVVAALALRAVDASPVVGRAPSDGDILNYALTLEHLENTFYRQGLENYTHQDFVDAGFADPFYHNVEKVAEDEKAHVDFLTEALSAAGASPVEECIYAFPATDVKSFVALANVLEGVGVSAYLGAAASIMDKTYLTAAGSILAVEARHSAYLRSNSDQSPFSQAFDAPLALNEVYTIASPFIASCPSSNPKLPVMAFPSLSVSPMGAVMENGSITVTPSEELEMDSDVYAAFVAVTGPVFTPVEHTGSGYSVTVPPGIAGQSYVLLTSSQTNVTDDTVLAGPGIVEVGTPTTTDPMASPSMSSSPTGTMSGAPTFTGAASRDRGEAGGVVGAAALVAAMLF
ncbi:hypothetical protein FQN54_003892 [Arachnomyces sp. PD_36]|nr:hypothetical protein FQN54_003892 [Arachnomyces sp. PD_36]